MQTESLPTNEPSKPLDFVPQNITPPQATTPVYELKKDVTGKPPDKQGPYILTDKNGTQVKFPHHPEKDCRKCHGRGHAGTNIKTGRLVACTKCYPVRFRR